MRRHQGIPRYRIAFAGIITIAEALAIVVFVCTLLPYAILAKHLEWVWGRSIASRLRAFTYKRMCRVEARIRVLRLHMRRHKVRTA